MQNTDKLLPVDELPSTIDDVLLLSAGGSWRVIENTARSFSINQPPKSAHNFLRNLRVASFLLLRHNVLYGTPIITFLFLGFRFKVLLFVRV